MNRAVGIVGAACALAAVLGIEACQRAEAANPEKVTLMWLQPQATDSLRFVLGWKAGVVRPRQYPVASYRTVLYRVLPVPADTAARGTALVTALKDTLAIVAPALGDSTTIRCSASRMGGGGVPLIWD